MVLSGAKGRASVSDRPDTSAVCATRVRAVARAAAPVPIITISRRRRRTACSRGLANASSAAPSATRAPAYAVQRASPPATSVTVLASSPMSVPPVSVPTWNTKEPERLWLSSLRTRHDTV